MQDKQVYNPKEKSKWRKLLWVGKLLITLLILSYIYRTFKNEQKGIQDIGLVFGKILNSENTNVILFMLLLVPVNWALESLKWQRLARRVVALSFRDAFRGTLSGLAIGVAAPAQLGDTIGRLAALKTDNKLHAIGAALISNGIQFYVSVVAGTIGWLLVSHRLDLSSDASYWLNILLAFIITSVWIIMLFRKRLTDWNPQKTYLKNVQIYLRVVGEYSVADLLSATSFGALRYTVFLCQFLLALSLFNFPVSIPELAGCVTLIFLAKTLIPAINVLGDLGLREFTALFVFQQYNLPPEEIIAATFLVWIINVLGPILVGIYLIWRSKWRSLIP